MADEPADEHTAARGCITYLSTPESFRLARGCIGKCSGEMRRIYRDSHLTLNAACAASIGFPTAAGVVCVAKRLDPDSGDASRTYWDELQPIPYRDWTLQEKLLPPRSLVYASDTLKYHCQTEVVSIGGALCEPGMGLRLPRAVHGGRFAAGAELSEWPPAEVVGCWVALAADEAPFGEVRCALLRLKAAVKGGVVFEDNGRVMAVGGDGEMAKIGTASFDAHEPRSGEMAVIPLMWDAQGSFVWGLVLEWMPTEQFRRVGKFENSSGENQVGRIDGLEVQVLDIV